MALSISHTERRYVNTLGVTALVHAFVAGQVADVITTAVFLRGRYADGSRAFPHLEEGNPFVRAWLEQGDWFSVIALKALVTVAIATSLLRMAHQPKLVYRVGALAGALTAASAIWWIVEGNLRLMGVMG